MVKAFELRNVNKSDLLKQLTDLKQELATLKVSKVSNQNQTKLSKIGAVRKDIARVLTVISQARREQLNLFYAGKKYVPTDLRLKKTRAIRRRLTVDEKSMKTLKQKKKDIHFPARKFAIQA